MKRKMVVFLLCIIICLGSLPVSVSTTVRDVSREKAMAADLKELWLFQGVSATNFDLSRAPSRAEAGVMLVRILGKEKEAISGSWKHPFTDVESWADKFVGYAYEKGLTSSYAALSVCIKGSAQTLGKKLIEVSAFTKAQYNSCYDPSSFTDNKTGTKLSPRQISEKGAPAVFYIETYAFNGELSGGGSGFFISSDGLAITNFHVAANTIALKIMAHDGKSYSDIKIIDTDNEYKRKFQFVIGGA